MSEKNEQNAPSGMTLPPEAKAQELDLTPKPRKATKIRKEIRVAVLSLVVVVVLCIVFGVTSKGNKQKSSASSTDTKPVQSASEVSGKDVEALQQQADDERKRKAAVEAERRVGLDSANGEEVPIPPGDPARDLNLPPTRIAQNRGPGGAGPAGAAAGNGQLTPAQQRALAEEQELQQAMKSPLGKGGSGNSGGGAAGALGRSGTGSSSIADVLKQAAVTAAGMGNSGSSAGAAGAGAAGLGAGGGSDDQNMQGDKSQFLAASRKTPEAQFQLVSRVRPISRYEIKSGWDIPATLEQAINSDLPGEVRGVVRENVYDTATGRYLLIPQGARVIGNYNSRVAYGQNGIQVAWTRLIYPDGSSIDLGGLNGQDVRGLSGFRDKVDNHYMRLIGFALLTSAFAAGVELSQNNTNTGYYLTPQQAMTQAVGQQVGELGVEVTRRNLNIQPTIKIGIGYRFTIRVRKDLIFDQPYKDQAALWK